MTASLMFDKLCERAFATQLARSCVRSIWKMSLKTTIFDDLLQNGCCSPGRHVIWKPAAALILKKGSVHVPFLSATKLFSKVPTKMEQDPKTLQSKKVEQDIPLITLRPFMISDVDDFMAWASDDRVMQFFGEPRTDKEAALAHIKDDIIPHPWYRAICVDERPVGWIFISPAPGNDHRRASMGYGLAYNHWGRGIMPAAVKKAVATIFKEWPRLERLEAFTAVENERSQRVLQKTGFQREGVLRKYAVLKGVSRDVVMFSFLSTDPILC